MNDKLLHRYNDLMEDEQEIMLILSVIYAPIGQNNFQDLIKKATDFKLKSLRITDKALRETFQKNQLVQISSNGWQCHPDISESLMKIAVHRPWFKQVSALLIADRNYFYPVNINVFHAIKQIRIFLYQGNAMALSANIERFKSEYPSYFLDTFRRLFFKDFDAVWFESFSDEIRFILLRAYLTECSMELIDCSEQFQLLERYFGATKPKQQAIVHTLIDQRLLRGNFKDAIAWLEDDFSADGLMLGGTLHFLESRNEEALKFYAMALKMLRKETNKRNATLRGLHGYFYNLALLRTRNPANLKLLRGQTTAALKTMVSKDPFYYLNYQLLEAVDIYQNKMHLEQSRNLLIYRDSIYGLLFQGLLLYWLGEIERVLSHKLNSIFLKHLTVHCQQAEKFGYQWYAAVSSALLKRINFRDDACKKIAAQYENSPFIAIIDLLPQVSAWERALEALTQLKYDIPESNQQELRLIWSISSNYESISIEPREQRLGKNGQWSKGRPIALKRLAQEIAEFPYLSEQDKRVCAKIETERDYGWYSKDSYQLPESAIVELVGHPHVYWAEQIQYGVPAEIKVAEPQLLVKEQGTQLHISLVPEIGSSRIITQKTAGTGLMVYLINDQHKQVSDILGQKGLTVPVTARQQVIDSIASIASLVTVQSDIGGTSNHAEVVPVDSRLHLHLQPIGQGLQIEVFVQPFSEGGPLYKPAAGGTTVLAEIDGRQLQTTRDFDLERENFQQLAQECPTLDADTDAKWMLDDPELALETLLYLQTLDENIVLEWPKGKKIQISREAGLKQVQFSVRKEKDWFSVEGTIQIDDQQVLDMQRLMILLSNSPGRFLKLEDGQIIALTKELRQRLDDLSGLGELQQDKVRFHPLAAHSLDEITNGMNITASKPWLEQLKKLNEMSELNPNVPSTLQGDLRDYQREGFQWMARLAHWGAGACLADDMGLGKTVQALAMILSRAPEGPTLILAPTSVCINWLEETQRFAPTLNAQHFGYGDRQAMLDNAGPFDVIVCSYGLLQTEVDRLAEKHWHTLVADEAQAIKNALTKRSKAAMSLQADFKLITTGTPIENHLGELWNLFNFINPGLLGSLQKFNERYAQAIENQHDIGVQKRLKKLLRPFILRRLKNDVLTELPSRTEVTLHIELTAEERAMYEALRRTALQSMKEATLQPGQQHLKILAEIMKLRRACCNPRLVMEESQISSSKLQAFEELVDELLENRHKALVFSQFVGHLEIIRELLEQKGIAYHYLDGSTPIPQRKKAVNAFQAGEGDIFLISLKAGGTGLNLTAADYVIHMDPWWNPAVEDQASDRAHRMGQKRPVTIYRLVAKDTIEDKIVELHRHKRDLANSLLEGGEVSGKMSLEDMMALISDLD